MYMGGEYSSRYSTAGIPLATTLGGTEHPGHYKAHYIYQVPSIMNMVFQGVQVVEKKEMNI